MNFSNLSKHLTGHARHLAWAAVAVGLVHSDARVRAEIPVQRFLERLQEERLQGLGVAYLEYLKAHGVLKPPFSDDFELTKLDLMQNDVVNIASAEKREARYKELEAGYKHFLETQTNHPRRGEARTKLAELYLKQGEQANSEVKKVANEADKEKLREKARANYQQAEKLFGDGVAELGEELKKVLGAKLDPSDAAGTARRQAMQSDYRKSQIMIGLAQKMIAESYAEGSAQRNDWLAKAEKQFNDVSTKASRNTEPGTFLLSVLYRGQVQAEQKKTAEATESLMRVAEQTEAGIFRTMRVQATTSLIRLLAAPPENKYEAAIAKGAALLQEQQTSEKDSADWQELQMAVMEAKDAWIKSMKDDAKNESHLKSQTKELRSDLQKLSRLQSPVGVKARELLANYGVDVEEPEDTKAPKVRNFADAFKEASERLTRWDQEILNISILETQLGNNPSNPDAVKAQISKLAANQDNINEQACKLLERSFQLFNPAKDDRQDLTGARLKFAYLRYRVKRFEDAAAVGELTARTNRGTPEGLQAAQIAIASYDELIKATSDAKNKPVGLLTSFSEFVLKNWPDSEVAGKASIAVLNSALVENRLDDAVTALEHIQAPDLKAKVQRDIGTVIFGKYLNAEFNAAKDGKDGNTPEILAIRDQSETLLQKGLPPLKVEDLDVRAVEAGWALASIQLRKDQAAEALETLNRPQVGPVAALENSSLQLSSKIQMDILRLVLQAEVSQASAAGQALNAARIETIVGKMQKVAGESPENQALLTDALIVLANELRGQIAQQKTSDGKQKVANSLKVLLTRLIDVSQDPTMLQWASTTLSELGKSIAHEPALKATADELSGATEKGFEKLIETIRTNPSFLEKSKRKIEDFQYMKAKALTANGKYDLAAKEYLEVLKVSNSVIPIQMDAATNYRLWSNERDEALLKKAAFGDGASVWGWNAISKRLRPSVEKSKDIAGLYYEARYQLADCQLAIGKAATDAKLKAKYFNDASTVIKQTFISSKDFGGDAAIKAKFDALMRSIQKELKEDPVGLKAFGG